MTCKAKLLLGDDYGDNECTIKCQLEDGHELPHKEVFQREGQPVTITWFVDETEDEAEMQRLIEMYDEATPNANEYEELK